MMEKLFDFFFFFETARTLRVYLTVHTHHCNVFYSYTSKQYKYIDRKWMKRIKVNYMHFAPTICFTFKIIYICLTFRLNSSSRAYFSKSLMFHSIITIFKSNKNNDFVSFAVCMNQNTRFSVHAQYVVITLTNINVFVCMFCTTVS